jgi:hypothetical protein
MEKNEEEENKEEEDKEEEKENKEEEKNPIEEAKKVLEETKKENDRREKLLKEEKQFEAEKMVGGRGRIIKQEKDKIENSIDYAKAVNRGEIDPFK